MYVLFETHGLGFLHGTCVAVIWFAGWNVRMLEVLCDFVVVWIRCLQA